MINSTNTITTQLNRDKKALLSISAFSLLLIFACKVISILCKKPVDVLFRDTVAVLNGPPYIGAMSSIGFVFWAMAAAISLFCFFSCREKIKNEGISKLMFASGVLSLALLIDDMFLFHEVVFPSLGIKEYFIYFTYGIMIVAYVLHFRKTIKDTDYTILAASFMFFALSIGTDFVADHFGFDIHIWTLYEDSFKFFGITFWFTFITITGSRAIRDKVSSN
jgi:hypothetical protein